MEMNGGFLVTKIKQLGDRIFEKILSEKNIDAFNGCLLYTSGQYWQKCKFCNHETAINSYPQTASVAPSGKVKLNL